MTAGPGLGPAIPRRRLGSELRRLRTEQGKKLTEVAKDLMISTSKLSRLEKGQGVPQDRDVRDLLDYYGIDDTDLGTRMWAWTEEARETPWWDEASDAMPTPTERYMQYETAAAVIRGYAALAVPTLLQTPAYSAALFRMLYTDQAEIDHLLALMPGRQTALTRSEYPVSLDLVIDEAVLHRSVGTSDVMRDQLRLLADSTHRDNVTLRVFPFSAGHHPVMVEGVFTYFHFRRDIDADVVNIEGRVTDQYVEQPDALAQYRDWLDSLRDRALNEETSRDFITKMSDLY
jgi:transcriptional regulator with XRE-family HTH domain